MNTQNMETIGGRLKLLRENEGLTLKDMGFELGISTDWILKGIETSSKDWRKLNEYYGYGEVVAIIDSFHNPMLRDVALNQLRVLQDMNKVLER